MAQNQNPDRDWRDVVRDATREKDPARRAAFIAELELMIDERDETPPGDPLIEAVLRLARKNSAPTDHIGTPKKIA